MNLNLLSEAVERGDRDEVKARVMEALATDVSVGEVLNGGLIAAMDRVGNKFQAGEIFIPHMLLAARAMLVALDILQPKLEEKGVRPAGTVILGTVKGDHHDIGKNLVGMMLKGKGFRVVDIGIDTPPERFVEAVDEDVQIVAMSALLSTTAPFLEETIEALARAGIRERVKILVGGGVVTRELADSIGADAYGEDAAIGADLALELVK